MIVESKKDILTITLGRIYSVVIMGYEKVSLSRCHNI